MNIKQFKLLNEDENNYEVAHPSGRKLSIAKKGLNERAHKIIASLKNQHMPDGGEVAPDFSKLDFSKIKGMGVDVMPNKAIPQQPQDTQSLQNIMDLTGNTPQMNAAPPAPQNPQLMSLMPKQAEPAIASNDLAQFEQANQMGQQAGQQLYNAGQQQQAAAKEVMPQVDAQVSGAEDAAKIAQDRFHEHYLQESAKADELQKLYETKKVDPDRIINGMSTGKKVMTAIGLMLGGLGASAYGGRNPAMDVLNNSIDRDIDAQKNDQSNTMNLWKMNRDMAATDMEAQLKTKDHMLGAIQAKLSAHAAQAGGAQTQLAASTAMQSIAQQRIALHQQIAAMKSSQSNDNLPAQVLAKEKAGVISPEQSKEAMKEAKSSEDAATLRGSLIKSFNELDHMFLAGVASPADASSARDFMAGKLGRLLEGRYNEEAAKKQITAILPGKFDTGNTRANRFTRLNELLDDLQYNTPYLQGIGLGKKAPNGFKKK